MPLHAQPAAPDAQCAGAIIDAERTQALPQNLLSAIARVEAGRPDPATGVIRPWPWTINAGGTGQMFDTKGAAIATVRALQAQGVRSIDVGCLQVNLLHHPDAFASLDEAFDPAVNAAYAARFLRTLFAETQDWPAAAAAYHSHTPAFGLPYRQLVLAAWGMNLGPPSFWPLSAPPLLATGPRPPLRPFAPPPLSAAPVPEPLPQPATTTRLLALAPECAQPPEAVSSAWVAARRAASCGPSSFAKVSLLQRALAHVQPDFVRQQP